MEIFAWNPRHYYSRRLDTDKYVFSLKHLEEALQKSIVIKLRVRYTLLLWLMQTLWIICVYTKCTILHPSYKILHHVKIIMINSLRLRVTCNVCSLMNAIANTVYRLYIMYKMPACLVNFSTFSSTTVINWKWYVYLHASTNIL